MDGVFDGESKDDFAVNARGKVQRRPSPEQLRDAMNYIFSRMPYPMLPTGEPRFGMEWISKVADDDIAARSIAVISEMYAKKFGSWPANYGKYPDDFVEEKPEPRPPVIPEEKPKEKENWKGWFMNNRIWIYQLAVLLAVVAVKSCVG